MRLFVTGGCGFIGSNFIHLISRDRPDWSVVNLDALTYAGNPANLDTLPEAWRTQYRFIHGNIGDAPLVRNLLAEHPFDALLNFAAETHVDRSIEGPGAFITTNVSAVAVLLEAARDAAISRFIQVSTDEVYGSLGPEGRFSEQSPLDPSSPYSASKAAGDLLALAWHKTFGLPVLVTRCSNNHGPYQFPEKLIPLMITRALADAPLPVYGDGLNVRDWIHVDDHCRAVLAVLESGLPGEVYNIGGDGELPNIAVVRAILERLGKPESLIRYVTDRPGHDRRYAIDASKLTAQTGWSPRHGAVAGISETVDWYLANESWWRPLLSR
jgi:dTDP-glucose 4,6-dehydratase